MASLVLARKWRPHTFDTVTGQTHVVTTLSNALTTQRLHHAYLFTGTRGVGKTSIARIFAKALSCETGITAHPCGICQNCQDIDAGRFVDLIEIDAASRSKVEDTRDILDNILYAPLRGRFKIYLIDEIHMLSGHSFNALLKTLEEPPEHVKFLLATTDPKKLPITVLSRCLQFHLKNMLPHEIIAHLSDILQKENIAYEASALPWIAQAADGSLRDALSLLDQAIAYQAVGEQSILQEAAIREMLGYVETHYITQFVEALIARDAQTLLSTSAHLQQQGADCAHILQALQQLFHQMTIMQCVPEYGKNLLSPTYAIETASQLAAQISPADLQLFYQIALTGKQDLSLAPTPWVAFEMTLLRMMTFQPVTQSEPVEPKPVKPAEPIKQEIKKNSIISPPREEEKMHWDTLLPKLNLTGLANIVAQYCVLREFSHDTLFLEIPVKHATSLGPNIKNHIKTALYDYFTQQGQPNIKVSFEVTNQQALHSPAVKAQEKKQTALDNAKTSFEQDPKFQKILNVFHGTIVPDSINI